MKTADMARSVDLVIAFTAAKKTTISSAQTRKEAQRAQRQYDQLLNTLTYNHLHAVGRRGESLGHLLVFISCPREVLDTLVRKERHSDFLSGLPVTPLSEDATIGPLSPADRIRLVHSYITSMPIDGGLGITPDSPEWDCIESIFPLHDREFNEQWIRSWKPKQLASVSIRDVREEFGDSVAYYYDFLSAYTYFLIFPAALGLIAYFFFEPYSPTYSILICIWSMVFVEWWRIHERLLSLRIGTRGSARVEKRRVEYRPGMKWWNKDLRVFASVPLITLFATLLAVILTGIFVLEVFVTQLYEGPGKQIVSFAPTILFAALVPRILSIYHAIAKQFTMWENHAHKSSHSASLTVKTFALSAIIAYLGLGLSAFVYVPFGEGLMQQVQSWLFTEVKSDRWQWGKQLLTRKSWKMTTATITNVAGAMGAMASTASEKPVGGSSSMWDMDVQRARQKLNPKRLKDQMFAYAVTNQVVDTFMEVGMPFVMRAFNNFWKNGGKVKKTSGSGSSGVPKSAGLAPTASPSGGSVISASSISGGSISGSPSVRKRVVFEDEQERGGMEEREFLDKVRAEAALPEYDLFGDYSEMVTQFGYIVVWSAIWPLTPVMALVNNFFEIRSDAFKMVVHFRRPIPTRTDSIGPWLDTLTFLTWLAAFINAALVYLFSPESQRLLTSSATLANLRGKLAQASSEATEFLDGEGASLVHGTERLLMWTLLVALIVSHGYILIRLVIRHVAEQVWWKERAEVKHREWEVKNVRGRFLKSLGVKKDQIDIWQAREENKSGSEKWGEEEPEEGKVAEKTSGPTTDASWNEFWDHDDGGEEIERISKDS
ncbi:calcium-activated chloride channel-domain-containing protein [Amanita rubescens]|nr:calcium-activated chloride channel-domain-containing protein [Amanita rubescens]